MVPVPRPCSIINLIRAITKLNINKTPKLKDFAVHQLFRNRNWVNEVEETATKVLSKFFSNNFGIFIFKQLLYMEGSTQ